MLNKKGIKVLSLFFIDKVSNYREYDKDNNPIKGKYAYNLIMKGQEKLLSIDNPLRFIFSHSALMEDWDNQNVFKICTLKECKGTYISRRQEIGRGLRLYVNQEREKVKYYSVNRFTVMANESYSELKAMKLKMLLKRKRFSLIRLFQRVKKFINLWNKIKSKTIYRLEFDSKELIIKSIEDIKSIPKINSPRMFSSKNTIDKMAREVGLEGKTVREDEYRLKYNIQLPDIITDLQNKTNLIRKTLIYILINSKRLENFKRNSQKYIEEVTKIIRKNLRLMVVDGISYSKFRGGYYYSIKMFNDNELLTYLNFK